jgi:medium-chain acyl-[acyl-carrier-protein] hydrolase
MDDGAVFVNKFKVHSYEVDFAGKLTTEKMLVFFQETAWNHAENLGVGYGSLAGNNRLWVLSRLALEIKRAPRWNEEIYIHTWPRGPHGLFALRDFEMLDSSNEKIASASSAWLVIDNRTRRPQKIEPVLSGIPVLPNRNSLAYDGIMKVRELSQSTNDKRAFQVTYGDLDLNGHVNNARYVGWAMDDYECDFHKKYRLKTVQINYLAETAGCDSVTIEKELFADCQFLHSMRRLRDNQEVCRLSAAWELI